MSKSNVGLDATETARPGQITRGHFDWSVVDPSTAVAELLADAAGCEPAEVGPLYDTVDSDALDSLVRHGESASDCTVTFPRRLRGQRLGRRRGAGLRSGDHGLIPGRGRDVAA
ncbi:HalOD1 output domain-containing protein [Haloarcula regularis]|uniref:HalOD1 output domain-containing protein n=1 Tax=Haloarcula regularis TaxID=3033392 RepID=UPI0023E784F8|nr:HalOD1 output domain-containing protein [Halomicroarcula sp. SYNS111]